MAYLYSLDKTKGDSGSRSEAISWNEDGSFKEVVGRRPVVGCSMLVGALGTRSFQDQDYWLTTPVILILEESENYVKFKTQNTIYEWKD